MNEEDPTTDVALEKFVYKNNPIRFDGETINMTDMWRAAGSPDRLPPAKWRAQERSEGFVNAITVLENIPLEDVFAVERGRGGATWAHWQVAMAYAQDLSHDFHAWCNQVVRAHMMAKGSSIGPVAAHVHEEKRLELVERRVAIVQAHATTLVRSGKIPEERAADIITILIRDNLGVDFTVDPQLNYGTPQPLPKNAVVREPQQVDGFYTMYSWLHGDSRFTREDSAVSSRLLRAVSGYLHTKKSRTKTMYGRTKVLGHVLRVLQIHPVKAQGYEITDAIKEEAKKYSFLAKRESTEMREGVLTVRTRREALFNRAAAEKALEYFQSQLNVQPSAEVECTAGGVPVLHPVKNVHNIKDAKKQKKDDKAYQSALKFI